jgi:serine protease inhibitor
MMIATNNNTTAATLITTFLLLLTQPYRSTAAAATVDSTQHRLFSDQLTSQIYQNPNEFSSALGVSMAFSLIYPGSTNDAVDEIRNVFGYYLNDDGNTTKQLVWEEVSISLTTRADGSCDGSVVVDEKDDGTTTCYGSTRPLLSIANSVWIDDGDALDADYDAIVGKYAKQIDFQSTDSPKVVNQWVNNQTNGLIESIVQEDVPLPGVLIAINSLYLKASWAKQFLEGNTNLDSFYSSPSRNSEVAKAHFMHQVGEFRYSHDVLAGYQVVQLPFASSSMSMVIVHPTTTNDDTAPIPSTSLLPALNDLKETNVALALPKFKFESMYDDTLKGALQNIGIVSPFKGGTQSLCGIFAADTYPCNQLFISRVLQKTVVDVNEEGVEAAAVTAIFIEKTSFDLDKPDPVLMIMDHPFQFFIYDQDEDLVLFEGRLGETEVPEGEPAASLLDSVHVDEDFWQSSFGVNPVNPPTMATKDSSAPFGSTVGSALALLVGMSTLSLVLVM